MITRRQLIDFLNEYDDVDEVRVVDEFGHEPEVDELTWAGGPWIALKGMTLVDPDEINEFLRWKAEQKDA